MKVLVKIGAIIGGIWGILSILVAWSMMMGGKGGEIHILTHILLIPTYFSIYIFDPIYKAIPFHSHNDDVIYWIITILFAALITALIGLIYSKIKNNK